jgi:hypothetical protein
MSALLALIETSSHDLAEKLLTGALNTHNKPNKIVLWFINVLMKHQLKAAFFVCAKTYYLIWCT